MGKVTVSATAPLTAQRMRRLVALPSAPGPEHVLSFITVLLHGGMSFRHLAPLPGVNSLIGTVEHLRGAARQSSGDCQAP